MTVKEGWLKPGPPGCAAVSEAAVALNARHPLLVPAYDADVVPSQFWALEPVPDSHTDGDAGGGGTAAAHAQQPRMHWVQKAWQPGMDLAQWRHRRPLYHQVRTFTVLHAAGAQRRFAPACMCVTLSCRQRRNPESMCGRGTCARQARAVMAHADT